MSTLWHDTEEALETYFGARSATGTIIRADDPDATVQDVLVALALHAPHVLGIGPAPERTLTMKTHPNCDRSHGHTCQQPSGDECVETGCHEPAGTDWGPHWCPEHDSQRLDRITKNLEDLRSSIRCIENSPKGN